MKFRMRAFFFSLILVIVGSTYGQSKLKFDEKEYDFGEIKEMDGPAEHTFKFVNIGEGPVRITHVKASCGCTTPGWTKEEVMPGDTGYVKAKYNPRNRPGRFRKSLRLTTTDNASNQVLYIKGQVKPRPKTPEEEYHVKVGDLRLKTRGLNLGKVTTEKVVEKIFDVYNGSDSSIVLNQYMMKLPDHIEISLVQDTLAAKQVGQLRIIYDPKKKNDFGYVSDNIQLITGQTKNLSVTAVIEEYFPEMTAEELDKAAKLQIVDRVYDFGTVNAGTIVEKEFQLINVGQSKLLFRKIKSNCGCITYELKNKGIKKGRSQMLKVFFDTSEMRGNQYKSVTIYSNDPTAPTQIITIKGKVQKQ